MKEWKYEIEDAIRDFISVADLANVSIRWEDFELEYLEAPHKSPTRLPKGKMAIYAFWYDGEWLKIGMAGPKSNARYTSQHYNIRSARSTLSASLVNDPRMVESSEVSAETVGDWIKYETCRVNILIDEGYDKLLLNLLEAFLHLRLNPRYEK